MKQKEKMLSEIPEFMDPFNDYAFKYIFRREAHKELLVSFLNDLLHGDKVIVDVQYNDSELQPETPDGRACSFDLFCTDQLGDNYIIEIQTTRQAYIVKRMLYYACRVYSEMAKKGDKEFRNVKGVIGICITKFPLIYPGFENKFVLTDRSTPPNTIEYLKVIFLQVSKISNSFEDCKSNTEQWLYIMKHINEMQAKIGELRKEYARLIEYSRTHNLSKNEQLYYISLENKVLSEIDSYETAIEDGMTIGFERGLEKGMEQGLERGLEQGMAKGMEKGIKQGKLATARSMMKLGVSTDIIMQATELSLDEINAL